MSSPDITQGGNLVPGSPGTAYSQTLSATGGTSPYTYAVTRHKLPPGLTLSSSGLISGTPAQDGCFSFTVTVTDHVGATGSQMLGISINAGSTLTISDIDTDLNVNGQWTNISTDVYNRAQPALTLTYGRQDETSELSPAQMTGQLNNRDGAYTSRNPASPFYPYLNRNTPVRLSLPAPQPYLRIADDAQSYAYTADSTALHLTGNFDIRVDMNPDSYMPCVLACKWGSTATAWAFVLNGDGTISLYWWDGSTVNVAQSTACIPLGRVAVRVHFVPNGADTVTFWTAPDMGGTFAQLGASIPITAGDTAIAASGQFTAVGYSAVFGASYGYGGFLGQIYEVQILNATPALVADPVFTSQVPGIASFSDGQSNTWAITGTAEVSARCYQFHGELASLPVAWDPSGHDIWVPFQAGGIQRRLGQGNANLVSVMRRTVPNLPAVVGYWSLEDLAGATQAASGLPGGQPMTVTGNPTFAADSTFACSNPIADINAGAFFGNVDAYPGGTAAVLRILLDVPSGTGNGGFAQITTNGTVGYLVIGNASGSLTITGYTQAGVQLFSNIGAPVASQGAWMVSAELINSGSSLICNLVTMTPGSAPVTQYTTTLASSSAGAITGVNVNPGSFALGSVGAGHVFAQCAYEQLSDLQAALAAHAGETAGNRYARLCAENGFRSRIYGFPDTSVVMGPQGVDTLQNLLQECETADNGLQYEPAECLGLGYRTVASLCNQSPAVTLDYSLAQVGDQESSPVSLTSVDDDLYTRNDITVTRSSANTDGSSCQYQLDDGTAMSISEPPAGVGDYANAVSVNVNTDSQLPDAAGWLVNIGTAQGERYPQIVTGLHRLPIRLAALGFTILASRVGDYEQVINGPAWLPPGNIDQIAAGGQKTFSSFLCQVSWNCVPEAPYETALYDDLVYGRADTDGSDLTTSYSATATSLSVATENSLSPLWTTSASDFPFDINIGGEQITVTNITGSSSPQTFTVTRSVNGVVQPLDAGADVRLFYPPIMAIV